VNATWLGLIESSVGLRSRFSWPSSCTSRLRKHCGSSLYSRPCTSNGAAGVSSQPIALTAARHYVTRSDPCPTDMRLADFSAALCPRDVINQHQQFADPMPRPFILCQAVTFGGLRHASARATALAHQIRSVKFTLALAANPCRWTLVDCLGSGPWPGSATTEQRHSPGRRRSNRIPPGTLRVLVITMGAGSGLAAAIAAPRSRV